MPDIRFACRDVRISVGNRAVKPDVSLPQPGAHKQATVITVASSPHSQLLWITYGSFMDPAHLHRHGRSGIPKAPGLSKGISTNQFISHDASYKIASPAPAQYFCGTSSPMMFAAPSSLTGSSVVVLWLVCGPRPQPAARRRPGTPYLN